jgi:hypothetical protein
MVVAHIAREYLRLLTQATESGAMDDAITITLIGRTIRMVGFRVASSLGIGAVHCVRRQDQIFAFFGARYRK